jgi:hypothetical protein
MLARALLGRIKNARKSAKLGQKWKFVANPGCCDKCRSMNGYTVNGPMPKWYPHVPDKNGRYNCLCRWVRVA